jgi:hypothetical protein
MELFALLLAVPVTFVTSVVYTAFVLAVFRFLPVVSRVLVAASWFVVALIVMELLLLAAMGARGTYAHLGHVFTAMHFLGFLLGPPAVANLVLHFAPCWNLNKWFRLSSVALCCWIACMAVLLGHIIVDEAIVGPDAGKPFYLTPPSEPNKAAAPDCHPRFPLGAFAEDTRWTRLKDPDRIAPKVQRTGVSPVRTGPPPHSRACYATPPIIFGVSSGPIESLLA